MGEERFCNKLRAREVHADSSLMGDNCSKGLKMVNPAMFRCKFENNFGATETGPREPAPTTHSVQRTLTPSTAHRVPAPGARSPHASYGCNRRSTSIAQARCPLLCRHMTDAYSDSMSSPQIPVRQTSSEPLKPSPSPRLGLGTMLCYANFYLSANSFFAIYQATRYAAPPTRSPAYPAQDRPR